MFTKTPRSNTDSLAALPLFEGLTRAELAVVDRHTTASRVAAGTTLCREGDFGQEAFIITSGEADVAVGGTRIASVGPGDVVGEMALLGNKRRCATVTATTPMTLLAMSSADFASIVHGANTVTRRILATLSDRLWAADRSLLAGQVSVRPRR